MKDKKDGEPVTGVILRPCEHGNLVPTGRIDGTLYWEEPEQGEVVYQDKNHSFIGGGNPRYATNYDQIDWN